MWACLAGMAATAQDLNTVEVAYAAINEVKYYPFGNALVFSPVYFDLRSSSLDLEVGGA